MVLYVGAAQSLSGGSADFSAAASALAKSKAAAGFELVLYTKRMGDGQQANNLVARVS
jgi:molybdopterin-containing oxidoreductase family iron-sulfur binding subunit